jgi:hypothetical protein
MTRVHREPAARRASPWEVESGGLPPVAGDRLAGHEAAPDPKNTTTSAIEPADAIVGPRGAIE